MKKLLSLVLVLTMMLSIMGGCSKDVEPAKDGETKAEDSSGTEVVESNEEPVVYKVFIGFPSQDMAEDNRVMKRIEEEFGIKFEIEYLVGDLDQKNRCYDCIRRLS